MSDQRADLHTYLELVEQECLPCAEGDKSRCKRTRRPCGHHCDHVWMDDVCCWCDYRGEAALAEEER